MILLIFGFNTTPYPVAGSDIGAYVSWFSSSLLAGLATLFIILLPILFWIIVIAGSVLLALRFGRKLGLISLGESPLDILKRRYARGEITKEQFDAMKRDLIPQDESASPIPAETNVAPTARSLNFSRRVIALTLLIGGLAFAMFAYSVYQAPQQSGTLSIAQLTEDLQNGRIAQLSIRGTTVDVTYTDGHLARTALSRTADSSFADVMRFYGVGPHQLERVKIQYASPPVWDNVIALFGAVVPLLFIGSLTLVIIVGVVFFGKQL
jgi:putative membrane protein